ncbi:MAG TPA: carboxypeptidase-like regulatory domain-containing protein, partial [Steroidobacteraceae bacterium]|nr:carboxypeptidase-like regulatory domain-containing protein [Steroidobacteraceae bacterium]
MQNRLLRTAIYLAMGASLAAALPYSAQAASDGSLVGRLTGSDNKPLANAEVTVRSPDTGFSRTVNADAEGNYRFPFLPVGKYVVEATKDGKVLGKLADVTVGLGSATTADVTLASMSIETIEVSSTRIITAVDVRSTESAMNITRDDLER